MGKKSDLYVESDNLLELDKLTNQYLVPNVYINNATVVGNVCDAASVTPDAAAATSEDTGSATGIPIANNTLVEGDIVFIYGTLNHDGVHNVVSGTTASKLVIDNAYVAETFLGKETIYKVVPSGDEIPMVYVTDSDGRYIGLLSDTAILYEGQSYTVFITATLSGVVAVFKDTYTAKFA